MVRSRGESCNLANQGVTTNNVIWRSYPSLNVVLVEIVAKAVCDYNHNYLFFFRSGETFFNPNEAYERLQNWAMCRSFAVVQRNKKAGNAARGTPNPMRVK
jgi:hypothetical protein